MSVLLTGAAGFIGFHLARRLLAAGRDVVAVDNLDPGYDPSLQEARLRELRAHHASLGRAAPRFSFEKIDLADRCAMESLFARETFDVVVNLAGRTGVRRSIEDPHAYVQANVVGFLHVLDGCRHARVKHLVYASSSSVYGANTKTPFSVHDPADHPLSLYAATKRTNELMAHTYASLHGLPCSGLRFFTVYGPWGRPDMAIYLFTKAIFEGRAIDVFNHGRMRRDFTYVDDVVEGVMRIVDHVATPDPKWRGDAPDPATSFAPHRLYDIGNHEPCELMDLIAILEREIGRPAKTRLCEMQAGDVPVTYADVETLREAVDFSPSTPLAEGVKRFVAWYRAYHGV